MAEQLRVFVSHSHQDDAFCRALVTALRGAGADVWYDEHNMGSGQLRRTIEQELKMRPVFVLILSPAALVSSWVEDETDWAYDLYRRDHTRTMLPVLAAPVSEEDIWLFIRGFKRVEAAGVKPYLLAEAVQRTVHALGLGAAGAAAPERSETAEDLITRGKALQSQAKYAEALPLFQRATQLASSSPSAWFNLGYTLSQLRRDQEALTAYEQATTLDPKNAFTWINKAGVLFSVGHYSEALAAAEQATTLDPKNAFIWFNRAGVLIGLGHYSEALAAAEQATTLDPKNAFAWINKASALRGLGRTKDAEAAEAHAKALLGN